ncbi:MAG: High-affinity nickel-transporter [Actinomycetota bacterium]|nr:High-affinity nickel-transporter [Actinomycetota bacterium]
MRRLATVSLGALAIVALLAGPAAAHPLGNFTTNTAAAMVVHPDRLDVTYVLDLAEIPTLQAVQRADGDGNDTLDGAESRGYRAQQCATLAAGLRLRVGDMRPPLTVERSELTLSPGQAGLDTLRLTCGLRAGLPSPQGETVLALSDTNLADRVGWREITATSEGMTLLGSNVPTTSSSAQLTAYPKDQLQSPLDQRSATLRVRPGPGSAATAAPAALGNALPAGVDRLAESFTDLVSTRSLTPTFALLAVGLALLLGSLHALAPGHGKTVVAAYLIGREGSARQALGLGATVAVTHTMGVLALGVLLSVTDAITPQRLYPMLGVASGLLFAGVGVLLLRQAWAARRAGGSTHGHDHDHGHTHAGAQGHTHAGAQNHTHAGAQDHNHARDRGGLSWRSLVAPGLAGGLVPSPSALVVLLGGIALGRAWFGVTLVIAYGVGMAAALVGAGYLLVRARDRMARRVARHHPGRLLRLGQALPVVTAALVTTGGLVLAARAMAGA